MARLGAPRPLSPAPVTHWAVRHGKLHAVWMRKRPSTRSGTGPHRYQIWGSEPVDVLEFDNGFLISIDETFDEPKWLRSTNRIAAHLRFIRFDTGGLAVHIASRVSTL